MSSRENRIHPNVKIIVEQNALCTMIFCIESSFCFTYFFFLTKCVPKILTIGGILNRNETYQDKLDRIKDISEEAYNEITANVREQARVNKDFDGDDDNETTFDKLKTFTDKVKGYFGEDTDKGNDTNNTGRGLQSGYGSTEADDAREQARNPANNNNNNNNNGGSTGGASRDKQQANRDLGASRGFNPGGR